MPTMRVGYDLNRTCKVQIQVQHCSLAVGVSSMAVLVNSVWELALGYPILL